MSDEYDEVLAENIAYWKARANERRLNGEIAVAISFDNIAWLLEHQMSWLAYQESQSDRPN